MYGAAVYYVLLFAAAGREMCRGEEVEVVGAMAMAEGRERPLAVGEEGEEERVRVVREGRRGSGVR